jgi:hypothetical protein
MFSLLERQEPELSVVEEPASGSDPVRSGCKTGLILQTGSLPAETGIRGRVALSASLCAEGSALAAISGHNAICAICVILGISAITWIYRTESPITDATKRRRNLWMFLAARFAVIVSAVAVLFLISRDHYGLPGQVGTPKSNGPQGAQRTALSDDSYVAVILWPKQPQEVKVVPPPPHAQSATVAQLQKPLVIPFQGVYWYLRAPAKAPGPSAHIAHGSPTRINIHSTDWWHPLIMEAHQRLFAPVDVDCCRELDLSILNADNRPGAISIAVELIDSSLPQVRSEDLGSRPVVSSVAPAFSLTQPPTNEVLRYKIPCHAHRRCTPERPRSGHRHPISCSVSRVSSPQTAFNPHTFTALAAYCKSPYPHCSAPAASEREEVLAAEHCRYGTRDLH